MTEEFAVRRATAGDAQIIAHHRAGMFTDMGVLPAALRDRLVADSTRYFERAIPSGEYLGWLAAPTNLPRQIVAGAGVQRRQVLPHPLSGRGDTIIAKGEQGIVLNVFTEPAWRRRGLAGLLMREVLEWAGTSGLETLVLHASGDGRPLYERLGFVATNEMRYPHPLGPAGSR